MELYFYNLLARTTRFSPKISWAELYYHARKGLLAHTVPMPREVPNTVVIKTRHHRQRASLG